MNFKHAIKMLEREIKLHKSTLVTWREWGLRKGDMWDGEDAVGVKLKFVEELQSELRQLKSLSKNNSAKPKNNDRKQTRV